MLDVFWGLWATLGLLLVLLVVVIVVVIRKGLFQWSKIDGDAQMLTRSWLVPSWFHFTVRLSFFVYCLAVILLSYFGYVKNGGGWLFTFYTIWNFSALCAVFFLLACHSGIALVSDTSLPKYLCRFTWVLYSVEFANVFLVDSVLWAVLYPQADASGREDLLSFTSINAHGANAVMLLLDLVLNDIELVPAHGIFMIIGCFAYVAVTWARRTEGTLANNNSWPYPFMDASQKTAPIWYFGLCVFNVIVYAFVYGMHKAKRSCYQRCSKQSKRGYSPVSGTTTMNISATCNNFTQGVSDAGGAANRKSRVLGWSKRTDGASPSQWLTP